MLPIVRPKTFPAHLQKFLNDLERADGSTTITGMVMRTMADNVELAVDILAFASHLDDGEREAALYMTCATYLALKAQAESELLQSWQE